MEVREVPVVWRSETAEIRDVNYIHDIGRAFVHPNLLSASHRRRLPPSASLRWRSFNIGQPSSANHPDRRRLAYHRYLSSKYSVIFNRKFVSRTYSILRHYIPADVVDLIVSRRTGTIRSLPLRAAELFRVRRQCRITWRILSLYIRML